MLLRSYIFKRIAIIGVGMMGGSLGMAIKKHGLAKEVIGVSHRKSALEEAIRNKSIDVDCLDVKKGIGNADLVILAAPVDSIIKLFSTINPFLKRGCLITDIGSAKARIVECAEKTLTAPSFFVGSHPLAGSEKKGVVNASPDLFDGATCVMTPTKNTNQVARQKVKHFWNKMGMEVKMMSPEEHDEALAYVSHLPHLLAYGVMESVPEQYFEFASTGFKDTTRIAASSPQMWNDICMANSKNVLHALDALVGQLAQFRKTIVNGDQKSLIEHFTKAHENHSRLK